MPDEAAHGSETLRHAQRRARRPAGVAPLTRTRGSGRIIAGVSSGMARFIGTDVRVVRTIWVVSLVPSLGITGFGYLALWLLLPLEPLATVAAGAASGEATATARS